MQQLFIVFNVLPILGLEKERRDVLGFQNCTRMYQMVSVKGGGKTSKSFRETGE